MTEPLSEQQICKIEKMLSGSYTWPALIQHTKDLIASHRLLEAERQTIVSKLGCQPAYVLSELDQLIERAERQPNMDDYRLLQQRVKVREEESRQLKAILKKLLDFHDPDSIADQQTDGALRREAEIIWHQAEIVAGLRVEE